MATKAKRKTPKKTPKKLMIPETNGESTNGVATHAQDMPNNLFSEVSETDPTRSLLHSIGNFNPDIIVQAKGGFPTFDLMRQDDQVHAALSVKKCAVLSPGWEVVAPEGMDEDDPEMKEKIEFLDTVFNRIGSSFEMSGSDFNYDLEEILTALDYGYSISEKVFDVIPDGEPFAGKIGVKALKTRKPHSFRFDEDKHGNLNPNGIIQDTMEGIKHYDPSKFIIYTYQPEFDNRFGKSDLTPAHREWFLKDITTKMLAIGLERFGEPLAVGTYKGTASKKGQASFETILKNLSSRNYMVISEAYEIELHEAKMAGSDTIMKAIMMWNLAIARAILIPKHIGITEGGEVGTLAQAKQNFEIFLIVVRKLRQDLEDRVIRNQLIRPLMRLNFERPDPMPVWRFKHLTAQEALDLFDRWMDALDAGAAKPTKDDEDHIREMVKFPERLDDSELLNDGEPEGGTDGDVDPSGGGSSSPSGSSNFDLEETLRAAFARADEGERHDHAEHPDEGVRIERKPSNVQERRFGFPAVAKELGSIMDTARDDILDEMATVKEGIFKKVSQLVKNGYKATDIRKYTNPKKPFNAIRRDVKTMMTDAFEFGRSHAQEVVSKKRFAIGEDIFLKPEAALKVFEERAFWITGVISDDVEGKVKGILHQGIATGKSESELRKRISEELDAVARSPELAASVSDEARTAHRIENVIRTNTMTAFNGGALSFYRTAPNVEGLQFSAILDKRTTEVCSFLHGSTFPKNDPSLSSMNPPLHFMCRSVLVPVLLGEAWEPIEQKDINRVQDVDNKKEKVRATRGFV